MAIGDVQRIGGGGASNFNAILNNRTATQEISPREALSSGDEQRRIGSANQSDLRTQNINARNSVDNISSRDRIELSGINNLDNARVNLTTESTQPNISNQNNESQDIPAGGRNNNVNTQSDENIILSTSENRGVETPEQGSNEGGAQVQTAPTSNPQGQPITAADSGVERTEERQTERISANNSQSANAGPALTSSNFGVSESSQVGSRLDVLA